MQVLFLALILNPILIFISTYFFPFVFGKLYKATFIYGSILTLTWIFLSILNIDIDLFFTFDGEYYYERLIDCLNFDNCNIGIGVRDFGFDVVLRTWYGFISNLGLINTNDSNYFIFLQLNVLLTILMINVILDFKKKYIGSYFDKNNIFLLSCPLFICFGLQLDREILIAFLVSLMIKKFIQKKYLITFILVLTLVPLRPAFFLILLVTFIIYGVFKLLRKIVQTNNLSFKFLLPIFIILFISVITYILYDRSYFLRYFSNTNYSTITLYIANLPFIIRSIIYIIISVFTPLIDFQSLTKPDPAGFILSFTGLWNLTLFIFIYINRSKFKFSNYLDKDFVYPVCLCLIFSVFIYTGVLFNVRHSVQFYPILFLFLYLFSFNSSSIENVLFKNDKLSNKSLINSFAIALALQIPFSILI